jgi:hypothetical protein
MPGHHQGDASGSGSSSHAPSTPPKAGSSKTPAPKQTIDKRSPMGIFALRCFRTCVQNGILTDADNTDDKAANYFYNVISLLYNSASNTKELGRAWVNLTKKQVKKTKLDHLKFNRTDKQDVSKEQYNVIEGYFHFCIEIEDELEVEGYLPYDWRAAFGNDWKEFESWATGGTVVYEAVKDINENDFDLSFTQCNMCGKEDKLQKCGRCGFVRYCSVECQEKHWPEHKKMCKFYREKRKEGEAQWEEMKRIANLRLQENSTRPS